jgi:hypothetical protein
MATMTIQKKKANKKEEQEVIHMPQQSTCYLFPANRQTKTWTREVPS